MGAISQVPATDTADTPRPDDRVHHPAPVSAEFVPPAIGSRPSVQSPNHHHAPASPAVWACSTRLLHHMADLFQEQTPRQTFGPIQSTDRKLRRRIREKKIAMGHRPDDHEDITIKMG